VQVKIYKIRILKASRRFRIVTHTKEEYYGILQESTKNGWVNILLDDGKTISMNLLDLNLIIALDKGFFARLNGNLSVGFSYTKSSSIGQFNLSSNFQFATERFEHFLSLSEIGSIDSSKYSRDRENGSYIATYSLTPAWYVAIGLNYQRNLELSIARRFQELIGAGNRVIVKDDLELLLLSGLTFNQEKSTAGISENFLLEIPFIVRFNFFKYHDPKPAD
jgi:hypothetical protein